ncbi:hypothetical protein J1N35_004608 [Gossypium stocksii]|uniref:Uncharacterized protein n=1 Tax=Gossypium stocksii TaxID=47602 RepID=A0A9D3WDY8_9ROSI|nr:hypothetical protein J1N35_004608 [Gossypium stocksii]
MWDAKMPLIVYAMVEIQESNRVMEQFGWRQQISLPLQDLKELHDADMHKKNNKDWREVHKKYIKAWDPSRICYHRRRGVENFVRRRNNDCPSSNVRPDMITQRVSSSAPPQEASPMSTQYPVQVTLLVPILFINPVFFSKAPHYALLPHVAGEEEEEEEEYEHKHENEDEDQDQHGKEAQDKHDDDNGDKDEQEGRGEGYDDADGGNKEVYRPVSPIVRRNPPRNCCP